ncbi:MAG: IS1634 family transposase, partial [Chloroflexi bacterium]|nr:IS1634 family transposase [Chloroflexota bacterium]
YTEQIDDTPLLYGLLQKMGLQPIVDKVMQAHGNRQGLSNGWTINIWHIHIVREKNHCMDVVQNWSVKMQETLKQLTGQSIVELDFTDDRLADTLRHLSDDERWERIERQVGRHVMRVYELPEPDCVRLDATSGAVTHDEKEHTLFKRGWGKNGKTEVQFKVMMSTIDPLGVPIAVDVVSGDKADDPLYLPCYRRSRVILGAKGLLYVGDTKMSALETRGAIHDGDDFYLTPLAYIGETPALLQKAVQQWSNGKREAEYIHWAEDIPPDGAEPDPEKAIAIGFETSRPQITDVNGEKIVWQERCLFIRSKNYTEAMLPKFQQRLDKAEAALRRLTPIPGKGKKQIRDKKTLKKKIKAVEKKYKVGGLFNIQRERQVKTRHIRAYRGKPARTEETVRYQISVTRNEEAIEQAAALVGWRIYATNATQARLSLTDAVLTYRNQYLVEQPFGRLKGRFLSITPLFVQRDDHAVGLIRLLTLAVRLLVLSEYAARRALAEEKGELTGVYAGNPKRGTKRPTTERMLRAFKHITLTLVNINGQTIRHITPLTDVQQRILSLFGLSTRLYASDPTASSGQTLAA